MLRTRMSCRISAARGSEAGLEPRKMHRNPNVSNILPLTTFRTIDLAGRKNPDRLFSRFWAELRVFFEVNAAPEYVQTRVTTRPFARLFLRSDQLAVLDFDVAHVIWQLQTVALFA